MVVMTAKTKKKILFSNFAKGFFIVSNDKGLHTRPSTELVKCANSFKAEVLLIYQNLTVNAK